MPSYSYVAVDKTGKEKRSSVDAENIQKANEAIRREGLIPVEVKEVGALGKDISHSFNRKVKARDLSVFCRQFVSMLTAGVTIIDALDMLSEQTENKRLALAIGDTADEVKKGHTLSEAMAQQGEVFPPMLINTVASGETSGNVDIAFNRMAIQFEKTAKLNGMIRKALIYPIILLIVCLVVLIAMIVWIIPSYARMFKDEGIDMPALTEAMVSFGDFCGKYWYIILAILIIIAFAIRMFAKTDKGQDFFGKIAIRLPIFGKLNLKTYSSMFARTLSTLIASGIPLIESMDAVAKVMRNSLFRKHLLDVRDDIAKGMPLSEPIRQGRLFPAMVCHMVSIGEESGDIEGMMNKLADYYDEEVELATQTVMAAIEPIIIIFMAFIVVLLIVSIYLPMFTLYNNIEP